MLWGLTMLRPSFTEANARALFSGIEMLGDAAICATTSAAVIFVRAATENDFYKYLNVGLYLWATALTTLIFIVASSHAGIYDPLHAAPTETLKMTARRFFDVTLLLTSCFFILKRADSFSRIWLVAWGSSTLILLCGFRLFAHRMARGLIRDGRLTKNFAIVGANEVGERLAARLAADSLGMHLVGLFDSSPSAAPEMARVRAVEVLEELASEGRVDEIIITVPPSADRRIVELCRRFHPFAVAIRILAPHGFEHFRVLDSRQYDGISTFLVARKPLDDVASIVKWFEDKVIAGLCLLLASPLLLIIAAAVKIDSPGPVFFQQKRLGVNSRPFNLLKFRSMYADHSDPLGQQLTRAGDPRVTRVGRTLRKTSFDELPQLINVLRGEMSLVGPRPHALSAKAGDVLYFEAVDDYPLRHRVKPGMTGWAQVNGWRGETAQIEQLRGRVACDLYYVENWSLAFDLMILGRTLLTVLSQQNAV
jgi:Undecaprenyl-phosphate glucose phosphotransferase